MTKKIKSLVTLTFLIMINGLFADNVSPVKKFILSFLPEYNHPGVMITFQIESIPGLLPYDLNINLPPGTKMALRSSGNNDAMTDWIRQKIIQEQDNSTMPLHVDQEKLFIQFFYNPFDTSEVRQFTFDFQTDHLLQDLELSIQEHLSAADFSTNLTNPIIKKDEFGISYHIQNYGNIEAGETLTIQFEYRNPDNIKTVEMLEEMMSQHPELEDDKPHKTTHGKSELGHSERYKYILVLLIPGVIIIVILFLLKIQRDQKSPKGLNHSKKIFCTECGSPIENNMKYCTSCGKEL